MLTHEGISYILFGIGFTVGNDSNGWSKDVL